VNTPICCIWLSTAAVEDLRGFGWDDELELGGALYGSWTEGRCYVDRVFQNPHGPQKPTSTTVEWDAFMDSITQMYAAPGDPREFVAVGDVHSHPGGSGVIASPTDLHNLETRSTAIEKFASLIVAPTECWRGGYPAWDWDDPLMGGWVGINGQVYATDVLYERRPSYA
jgi:hypothetical protein